MESFFMKDSVQSWINIVLAIYALVGMMVSFIGTEMTSIPYAVSVLSSLLILLIYNWWISEQLYKRRKQQKS